jgi:hypothetical protein
MLNVAILSVIMLTVSYTSIIAEYRDAEWCYDEYQYVECLVYVITSRMSFC